MKIKKLETTADSRGLLQVNVVSSANHFPIDHATVSIAETDEPDQTLEEVDTNASGQTPEVSLPAPPLEYSMEAGEPRPYQEYTLKITAPGFEPVLCPACWLCSRYKCGLWIWAPPPATIF